MTIRYSSSIAHRSSLLILILTIVSAVFAQPQQSANFRMVKSVLDAGGQASNSSHFRLTSAFGQPTPVGAASSASFVLQAGFLSPVFAVSPLSPIQDLVIQPQGADILLAWTAIPGAAQYKLYRTSDVSVGPVPSDYLATVSVPTFTDVNVTATSATSYYIVTALNASGAVLESRRAASRPASGLSERMNPSSGTSAFTKRTAREESRKRYASSPIQR